MEYSAIEKIIAVVGLLIFGLTQLARRYPDVEWLRHFRIPELPAALRERHRKRNERLAGAQFILLGLVMPIGYVVLTAMTFGSIERIWLIGVMASSVVCIGLGIYAIAKNW